MKTKENKLLTFRWASIDVSFYNHHCKDLTTCQQRQWIAITRIREVELFNQLADQQLQLTLLINCRLNEKSAAEVEMLV